MTSAHARSLAVWSFLLGSLIPPAAAAAIEVGAKAPAFALGNLNGKLIDSRSLGGRPHVLVVGTAKEAAAPCREWMLTLQQNLVSAGVPVHQVIVLNNPWYVPHFAVVDQVRGFVPAFGHSLVLLEWKRGFGDAYGIPYDFDPRVLVVDADGKVRLVHRGAMNDADLSAILAVVDGLAGPVGAAAPGM